MKNLLKFVCNVVGYYCLVIYAIKTLYVLNYLTHKVPQFWKTFSLSLIQNVIMIVLSLILIIYSKTNNEKKVDHDQKEIIDNQIDCDKLSKILISALLAIDSMSHIIENIAGITLLGINKLIGIEFTVIYIIQLAICIRIFIKRLSKH